MPLAKWRWPAPARIVLGSALLLGTATVFAQEIEPRTYVNTPVGVNFLALGFGLSRGNVLMDPSLPIEDLDARVNLVVAKYVRSLGVFGKAAKVKVFLPFAWGDWTGSFQGQPDRRSATGLADAQFEIAVNFKGAPALTSQEFVGYSQRWIVGAGLRVVAPIGDYDDSRLINLGSNRWAIRPEIGASRALGNWTLEVVGAVWFFTDNEEFLAGLTVSQDPIYVIKAHAVRSFRPGFWLGVGVGYGNGGRTQVDGVPRDTTQRNWRLGVVLAYPLANKHGVSFALGSGVRQRAGTDFDSVLVAYQYAWGGI